jgi:type IV secretion system protein TrbL
VIAERAPMIDVNPFHWVGGQVKEGLADVFTAMMMSFWSAALWLMDLVFGMLDRFLTPDVTDPGLNRLYGITLWLSLLVALLIGFTQVGLAAVRRDGRSLGSLAMGIAQYGAVVAGWIVVCGGLVVGCAGLTRALLGELLDVPSFAGYSAAAGMPNQVVGTVQAAVPGDPSRIRLSADHAGARGGAAHPHHHDADRRCRRTR